MDTEKKRAPMNRTLILTDVEIEKYKARLVRLDKKVSNKNIINKTINQDLFEIIDFLPGKSIDLLFVDPPYNLAKDFNGNKFNKLSIDEYSEYLDSWLSKIKNKLKDNASIYICGDYNSSTSIHLIGIKHFNLVNRITWQREKGRGAKTNWKNSSEDIWFFSVSKNYKFYVDRVKEKRKVIAPYKVNGKPKDWMETDVGNFRITYPSNIWTDLSVPYWSMPENTDHPTQKPEKLLAKIILASSDEGDIVFDPFLGSGTTSVVAKKLGRNYIGVEKDLTYCCFAEKRLEIAEKDKSIQGYEDCVFWERNTLALQKKNGKNGSGKRTKKLEKMQDTLF
ncbi:MAG: site-specific DNA-methyltransferase [Bacteroidetes bacterium]|nr:site-specific DNA-methyltransferase [Bacteroidota bacterium]